MLEKINEYAKRGWYLHIFECRYGQEWLCAIILPENHYVESFYDFHVGGDNLHEVSSSLLGFDWFPAVEEKTVGLALKALENKLDCLAIPTQSQLTNILHYACQNMETRYREADISEWVDDATICNKIRTDIEKLKSL